MTRSQLRSNARQSIKDCVTQSDAIRAGLVIAACNLPAHIVSADGCAKAAKDIADVLDVLYPESAILGNILADCVKHRAWGALWLIARRNAYPNHE